MTLFDVRIPGLKMTVIAADGQYVDPVLVDEFRIGVAETYDVLVTPDDDMAYAVFAQAIDRSLGLCRGQINIRPQSSCRTARHGLRTNPDSWRYGNGWHGS